MPASSIPKQRLIHLICDDLIAGTDAAHHFNISAAVSIRDRLASFAKPDLIEFILSLGPTAERALQNLDYAFPLRRPPTLYLAFVESGLDTEATIHATRQLAQKPRKAAIQLGERAAVQSVFVDQPARLLDTPSGGVLQIVFQYERRIDYIEANPRSDSYGMAASLVSLETAFVWIPNTPKPKHGVMASCDYTAIRHILDFTHSRLGLRLYLTNLDIETLRTIVGGATPRSATFRTITDDPEEVQTLTLSDPILSSKPVFTSAIKSRSREQTSGFYVNHPGLPSGGMGISRREGRVWVPSRLDYAQLAHLSLQIIQQTETKLRSELDPSVLVAHFYGSRAHLGGRDLTGAAHDAWTGLLRAVIQASRHPDRQSHIPITLLEQLIRFQSRLFLSAGLRVECPSCGYSSLASCPTCRAPLSLKLAPGITPLCRVHIHNFDVYLCDCGTEIIPALSADAYIIPERTLVEAICTAASVISDSPFDAFFVIAGTLLHMAPAIAPKAPARINLNELALWQTRAHLHTAKSPSAKLQQELIRVLNGTKEKCFRDQVRPSVERCLQCKSNPLDTAWLPNGDLCLPRVLGVAIDQPFDGVHHGLELADIKYDDSLAATGRPLRVGIHVKSRVRNPSPQGVGRSKHPVKGLYAQVVFSAYETQFHSPRFDAIGIAMPNSLLPDVLESMQFAVNKMGYSFLAVTEHEWLKIVRIASEKIEFG